MKTLKSVSFILSVLMGLGTLYADDGSSNGKTDVLLERKSPKPSRGPRMPSNQHLWFSYDSASQQCDVTMNDGIEYLNVTIEQLPVGFYYVGDVTPDNTTMSVEIPAGYYRITCMTDEGVTFVGEGDIN